MTFSRGPKNQTNVSHRYTQIGYRQISRDARINKRNVALIVQRLIEKGFVAPEKKSCSSTRASRQYVVASYRAALEALCAKISETPSRPEFTVEGGEGNVS